MLNLEFLQNCTQPDAAAIPSGRPVNATPRPSLVWSASPLPAHPNHARVRLRTAPAPLHLVSVPKPRRAHLPVPRKTRIRARLIESAYVAGALTSAMILWWTAR